MITPSKPQCEKKPRKKLVLRGPDDGNLLWKLYSELGATRKAEFKKKLADVGIPLGTFHNDTESTRALGIIRADRIVIYREFFLKDGVDLYQEVARPQEEARQQAARTVGLQLPAQGGGQVA